MSQWECAMALLPEGILDYTMNGTEPERIGNEDPLMAPHGVYKCRDRAELVAWPYQSINLSRLWRQTTPNGAGWRGDWSSGT